MTNDFLRRAFGVAALVAMLGPPDRIEGQEPAGERHEHSFHANHVSVFTGATSQPHDEGTHATLGAEYVRRFGSAGRWGVGVASEVILAGHTEWIFAGTASWFPWRGLAIRGGAGVELYQKAGSGDTQAGETTNEASALVRAGAGYVFAVGQFTVAPVAMFDFVRNTDTFVWGIEFGRGF